MNDPMDPKLPPPNPGWSPPVIPVAEEDLKWDVRLPAREVVDAWQRIVMNGTDGVSAYRRLCPKSTLRQQMMHIRALCRSEDVIEPVVAGLLMQGMVKEANHLLAAHASERLAREALATLSKGKRGFGGMTQKFVTYQAMYRTAISALGAEKLGLENDARTGRVRNRAEKMVAWPSRPEPPPRKRGDHPRPRKSEVVLAEVAQEPDLAPRTSNGVLSGS